jgi:hypothetical protein
MSRLDFGQNEPWYPDPPSNSLRFLTFKNQLKLLSPQIRKCSLMAIFINEDP